MDLNNIPKSALRPPLRVVRITQPVKDVEVVPEGLDLPDLPVFDGGEQLPEEERLPDPEPQVDLQTWLEDEITEDTPLPWKTEIVDKGFTNEPPEGEQPWYVERLKSRDCPVCPAVISIIDEGEDLLGLGMSLEAAQKLEAEYAEHLEEHPRSDFLKRIHELQEQTVLAPRPASPDAAPAQSAPAARGCA